VFVSIVCVCGGGVVFVWARRIIKNVPYSTLCLYCSMVPIIANKIMYITHYVPYVHTSPVSVAYLLLDKEILMAAAKFIFNFSLDNKN